MDEFKLSDDTMRDLRNLAQSPGELEWRLNLLAKIERMSAQHQMFANAVVGELKRLKRGQVGPIRITEIVRTELKEKLRQTTTDSNRVWKTAIWILERAALMGVAYLGVKLGMKT